MPKKLEGYCSGRGRHTVITSYGYGMLRLKEGPNQPGPIFSTLYIYFVQFFYQLITPFGIAFTYAPKFFYFRDPISRLTFATHIRDSCFATPLATHIRDSRFTTPLATHFRDSRLRLH